MKIDFKQISNFKGKSGFTLAEVLITLGIIGVVAAMTLPVLVQKYQEHVLINQLKRVYSVLSQTVQQLNYEYDGNWDISPDQLFDDMTEKINAIQLCKWKPGCFESSPVQYLTGGSAGDWNALNKYKFVMNTGEFVLFNTITPELIEIDGYTVAPKFIITVDINGIKKPNRFGKDIFQLGIRDGALVPSGIDTKSEKCKIARQGFGYDCAWQVLTEGKFPKTR